MIGDILINDDGLSANFGVCFFIYGELDVL